MQVTFSNEIKLDEQWTIWYNVTTIMGLFGEKGVGS